MQEVTVRVRIRFLTADELDYDALTSAVELRIIDTFGGTNSGLSSAYVEVLDNRRIPEHIAAEYRRSVLRDPAALLGPTEAETAVPSVPSVPPVPYCQHVLKGHSCSICDVGVDADVPF